MAPRAGSTPPGIVQTLGRLPLAQGPRGAPLCLVGEVLGSCSVLLSGETEPCRPPQASRPAPAGTLQGSWVPRLPLPLISLSFLEHIILLLALF